LLISQKQVFSTPVMRAVAHPPAFWNGTRLSPLDGKNLARVFPGKLDEGPSGAIAHYLANAGSMPHGVCAAAFVRIGDSIIGTGGEVAPGVRGKWTIEAHLP